MNPLDAALLDAEPELVLQLGHREWPRRRLSALALGTTLGEAGWPAMSRRMAAVGESAPQVLETPAAWQWTTAVLRAARRSDTADLKRLGGEFARFELAAAHHSNGDAHARLDGPNGGIDLISLPGTDVAVPRDRAIEVSGGEIGGELHLLARTGALVVDPYDPSLRHSAGGQFEYVAESPDALYPEELTQAQALAEAVAPTLPHRFASRLVPVRAGQDEIQAATTPDAPGVTYLSFGSAPCCILAVLAHEEGHAVFNSLEFAGYRFHDPDVEIKVPWKQAMRRLPAVLHGLSSFSRAATVRRRSIALTGCPRCTHVADIEAGWVSEITEAVLGGHFGELPGELTTWLDANRRQITEPAASLPPAVLKPLASATGGKIRWSLHEFPDPHLGGCYLALRQGRWERRTTDFYRQDVIVDPRRLRSVDLWSGLERHFSNEVVRVASDLVGVPVKLTGIEAHRYRTDDFVDVHTDHERPDLRVRAVLGLTPGHTSDNGGSLEFVTESGAPVVSVGPAFGQVLVFEPSPSSRHRVAKLRSDSDRITVVASYTSSLA